MENNWSLKGKEIKAIDDVSLYPQWSSVKTFYSKEDIETLRQKLIEDIQRYIMTNGIFDKSGFEIFRDIRDIINKRFGFEEKGD